MNIVRKIHLNSLGCYQIKDNEKELFDFVKNEIIGLKAVEIKEYIDYVMYFNSNDKCIFQHNLKNNYLYVNSDIIWSVFEKKFGYNYQETKKLIKNTVEQVYKLYSITTILQHLL